MVNRSRGIALASAAVLGLLFLAVISPWSSPLPSVQTDETAVEVPPESHDQPAEVPVLPSEARPEPVTIEEASEIQLASEEPINTVESTPILQESPPPAEVESNDDSADATLTSPPAQSQDSGNSVVVHSPGGGHKIRSSSSTDSEANNDDNSGSDASAGSDGVSGSSDEQIANEDESFFVLPESPIGAIAMVLASTSVLAMFMVLRAKSR